MQYVVKMGMGPNLVNCKNGKQHLVAEMRHSVNIELFLHLLVT